MASYDKFSKDNVALVGSRDIAVFRNGEKVGRIPLGSLRQPSRMERLYSFGIISDPHIGETDATYANLRTALTHFANDSDVKFSVNCGDLVNYVVDKSKTLPWFQSYRDIVLECSGGKSVFAIGGNHEPWANDDIASFMKDYVGNQSVWYAKEFGNDIFLFLGVHTYATGKPDGVNTYQYQDYPIEDVRAIHEYLDANKNKRCFVFQHIPISEGHGDYDIDGDYTIGFVPISIYHHYKNITVFHGHTHSPFSDHFANKGANVNRDNGFRSVHVPSLGDHCEGYVVDVYEDGIHLRGLNFNTGYIPIASYWIDTALVDITEDYIYKEKEV